MPAVRPEFENPPELFYSATEARRYTVSTRIRKIQREMTLRALELLNLPKIASPLEMTSLPHQRGHNNEREHQEANTSSAYPSTCQCLLLDIGCGSGLSGEVLTEEGHAWIGVDVSREMLTIAKEDELRYYNVNTDEEESKSVINANDSTSVEGHAVVPTRVDTSHVKWGLITSESDEDSGHDDDADNDEHNSTAIPTSAYMSEVLLNDAGQGLPFRPGCFDGCVSISALQWLCHSSRKGEVPQRRLMCLFQSLYNLLRRGAKAAMQFYPSHPAQIHMITTAAMKCGFSGGVVIDFPHSTRAKKHYLVIQAGQVGGVGFVPPAPLTNQTEEELEYDEEDYEEEGSDDSLEEHEYEEDESHSNGDDDDDDGEYGNPFDHHIQVGERGQPMQRKRPRAHASNHATSQHQRTRRRKDNRPVTGTRDWVLLKKEERRRRGMKTTADSKYTMRRRRPRF